jgi:hypothetical protein
MGKRNYAYHHTCNVYIAGVNYSHDACKILPRSAYITLHRMVRNYDETTITSCDNAWDRCKDVEWQRGKNESWVCKLGHDKIALKSNEFHVNIIAKHDEMLLGI